MKRKFCSGRRAIGINVCVSYLCYDHNFSYVQNLVSYAEIINRIGFRGWMAYIKVGCEEALGVTGEPDDLSTTDCPDFSDGVITFDGRG